MSNTSLSRGPSIDTDLCVKHVGNRYDLVLIAAVRAREIRRRNVKSRDRKHVHSNITAILDVQSGTVGRDYLKKIR